MDYTLDLIIDKEDLKILNMANMKITIAKPVGGASAPNVNWLVFDPFEGNTIEWTEEFGIYVSPLMELQGGAKIDRISEVAPPALDGKSYTLSGPSFSAPTADPSVKDGEFAVKHDYKTYPIMTFGLTQKASIVGRDIKLSPLNAALVPLKYNAKFTPITTVWVWMQNSYKSGTVLTDIIGSPTVVEFKGGETKQSLKYDSSKGRFIAQEKTLNQITFINPKGIY